MKLIFAHLVVLSAFFVVLFSSSAIAQITTDNSLTPEELVALLVGPDVEVSNISFTGVASQRGTFVNNNGNLPIAEGIVLSSGDIALLVGPNSQSNAGTNVGGAGYPDLNTLSGVNTFDAAVLEFDFVATGDSLSFNYSFGSEEYNEYVGGGVNDTFGLFLDGPGISGSFDNGSINLAIIPESGETPVSINTVNLNSYSAFYVDNETNSDPNASQMDGLTVLLEAGTSLQCGETYHIRLCIADGGDGIFDSVVMLEAGSFSAGSIDLNADAVPLAADGLQDIVPYDEAIGLPAVWTYSNGESFPYGAWSADNSIFVVVDGQNVQVDAVVIEGCNDAQFTVIRPEAEVNLLDTLYLELGGSAFLGIDFSDSFNQVIMTPGQSSSDIQLGVIDDGFSEGVEFVVITFEYVNGCGETVTTSSRVVILDPLPVEVTPMTVPCQSLDGEQLLGYDNVTGYGPFNYVWGPAGQVIEWDNASEDPSEWTTSFDAVFSVFDQYDELVPTLTVPLQVVDQCGKVFNFTQEVRYPIIFDDEICLDERQDFPALNADVYVEDVRFNGASLITGLPLGDTLYVDANAVGDRFKLNDIVAGSYPWEGVLTLIDTCGFETEATIKVRDCVIPNVFSPNSDAKNDNFRIRGLTGYGGSQLLIYNRYGTVIFKDETLNDTEFELVWNGRYSNGDLAPEGTYQWVLLRADGLKESGPLTLLRKR